MKNKLQPNDRQRRFAELIVSGETAKTAYFGAFPRCRSPKTAETEGCKLLKNPKVAAFIKELRGEVAELVKSNLVAEKSEALEFLTKVLRTPIGEIDKTSVLGQEFTVDQINEEVIRTKVKMPDKLRAIERMAKMLGWDEAEKHQHEAGDALASLIASIRRREETTQTK